MTKNGREYFFFHVILWQVFDKYRRLVEESDIAPILLFNEADAIFGIRREAATDAVDKMEHSRRKNSSRERNASATE